MAQTISTPRPTPAQSTRSDAVRFGPVHLDVCDLERSLCFWRDLIGLTLCGERDGAVVLGVRDAELVVLHPGARGRAPAGHSGLYHLAIHLPSEAEFARLLTRLLTARYPNSPTDHVMHWATYLYDPDGIMLECSFETLDRFGHYELSGARPVIVGSDGRRYEMTAALDIEEILGHLPDRELDRPLAPQSRIGHIHLHVGRLQEAVCFYEALGFGHNVTHPIGMAELHAHGSFFHRLALNVWQGVGAPPAPAGMSGMRLATLRLADRRALDAALERVRALGGKVAVGEVSSSEAAGESAGEESAAGRSTAEHGTLVRDPSGNRLLLVADER